MVPSHRSRERVANVGPPDVRAAVAGYQCGRKRNEVVIGHVGKRIPADRARLDRLGQSLQLEGPDRLEPVTPTASRERPNQVCDENLTTLRGIAQTGSFVDRCAEAVVTVEADVTHRHADANDDRLW